MIQFETHIPKKGRDIHTLLEQLWNGPYEDETSRSVASYMRSEILKELYPTMRSLFGSAENVWRKIEQG